MTLPPVVDTIVVSQSTSPAFSTSNIFNVEIEEALSQISSASIIAPISILDVGGGINEEDLKNFEIGRTIEGTFWQGYVQKINKSISNEGVELLDIQCVGNEIELVWANVYRGVVLELATVQDSFDALLIDTGWTCILDDSLTLFPATITQRFDDMTVFESIQLLAKICGAFIAFHNVTRQIVVTNSNPVIPTFVNIRKSTDYADGILESIPVVQEDRSQIFNRIVCLGNQQGNLVFNLNDSDRTTPYTIESLVKAKPRITGVYYHEFSFTPEDGAYQDLMEVTCVGRNCAVVLVYYAEAGSISLRPKQGMVTVDGQTMFLDYTGSGGTDIGGIAIFGALVKEGIRTINWRIQTSITSLQEVNCIAIALCDVNQEFGNNIVDNEQDDLATGTTPSVSILADIDDLVMDFLSSISGSEVPTEVGQVEVLDEIGFVTYGVSYRHAIVGSGTPTDMSWLKGTSNAYTLVGMRIRAQPVYYIEDATSIAEHELRVKHLSMSGLRAVQSDLVESANSVYDCMVSTWAIRL